MILKKIKKLFSRKEKAPKYPNEFIIIDFSPIAKQNGIRDNQNKIIYRYYIDSFGHRKVKAYKYSEERLDSFINISLLPVIDKTKKKEVLPVFGKVLPSEIEYNR